MCVLAHRHPTLLALYVCVCLSLQERLTNRDLQQQLSKERETTANLEAKIKVLHYAHNTNSY